MKFFSKLISQFLSWRDSLGHRERKKFYAIWDGSLILIALSLTTGIINGRQALLFAIICVIAVIASLVYLSKQLKPPVYRVSWRKATWDR